MQFYKKRDFGNFISDTFNFLKTNGWNYFKNYLLLNGLLLILLVVVFVFGYREIFMQLMGGNLAGETYYFEQYFEDNLGILILVVAMIFILAIMLTVLNYLFPVFYLKRKAEGQLTIKPDDILSDFKKNSGKVLKFLLGLIFILAPLFTIVVGISIALMFVIIGVFLMIFIMPVMMNFLSFFTYDYFSSDRGYFESMSYSLRAQFSYPDGSQKSPFWKYWGGTTIMYFIVSTISYIFLLIPMVIFYAIILTVPQDQSFEENPLEGSFGLLYFVMYGLYILVATILSNLMYINSGFMYYDNRTDLHQKEDLTEIDSIGINEI